MPKRVVGSRKPSTGRLEEALMDEDNDGSPHGERSCIEQA